MKETVLSNLLKHPWKILTVILCFVASILGFMFLTLMAPIPVDAIAMTTTTQQHAGYQEAIQQGREELRPLLEEFPGLAVAVSVGEEVVWSEGVGYADMKRRTPVTGATKFRIYSVSKPITAVAAARLAEEGTLDLDAPIGQYLPTLPDELKAITTRHLGGHLSGVRHYAKGEISRMGKTHCASVGDAFSFFVEEEPMRSAPGEQVSYSTYGYILLSAVLEASAGQPFQAMMHDRIFVPTRMASTRLDDPQIDDASKAMFYQSGWLRRMKKAPRGWDNTCKWGGGGFLSTAEDLVLFGQAVLSPSFLSDASRELLFTSMKDQAGEETGYSFGWGVGEDEGRRYAAFSGGALGGRAALVVLPDEGIVVALLSNMYGQRLTEEAGRIAAYFVKE